MSDINDALGISNQDEKRQNAGVAKNDMTFITPSIAAFWYWLVNIFIVGGTIVAYVVIAQSHSGYNSTPWTPWEVFLPIISCVNGLVVARIVYEVCVLFFKHYDVAKSINRNLEELLKTVKDLERPVGNVAEEAV